MNVSFLARALLWAVGAVCVTLLACGVGYGDIQLIYDGFDNLGGGMYQYNYHGQRDPTPNVNIEDLHIEGTLQIDPGQVNLLAPNDWAGFYDGHVYNWTVNASPDAWSASTPELYGFAIQVAYPTVRSTPFHWTEDRDNPGDIVTTGYTLAPGIPEPSTIGLLCTGLVLLIWAKLRRVA